MHSICIWKNAESRHICQYDEKCMSTDAEQPDRKKTMPVFVFESLVSVEVEHLAVLQDQERDTVISADMTEDGIWSLRI